jgi:hypothetical protein
MFVLFIASSTRPRASVLTRGGTLILAIPVREGLVLCGDRLISDNAGVRVAEETKIRPIGTKGAFVLTGTVGLDLSTTPRTVLFDANELTEKYLKGRDIDKVDWDDYCRVLGDAFKNALERVPFDQWPPSRRGTESVFQVLVFYVDAQHDLQGRYVRLEYLKQQPPQIDLSFQVMVKEQFDRALPIPIGNQKVYKELKAGHSPDFDDLRRSAIVQRFIKGTEPSAQATSDDAIKFSRIIIEATSTEAKLLPGRAEPVGPDCDCFVLDRHAGLQRK